MSWHWQSNVGTCSLVSGLSCLVVNFHFLTSLVLPLGWYKRTAGNKSKQKAIRYRKISFILQVVLIFQASTHFFLYATRLEPICQPIGELITSHVANLLRVSLVCLQIEKMASQFNGHELGQTLGDDEGQGGLVCCSPWGRKGLDTTWWLNSNNNRENECLF